MSSTSSPANASFAIASIWAWLVPHFYIEFSEWRLAILQVDQRSKSRSNNINNNSKSDGIRDEKNLGDSDDEDAGNGMKVVNNSNTGSSTSGSSPPSKQASDSPQERTGRRRRKKTDRTVRVTSMDDSDRDFDSGRERCGGLPSEHDDGQEDDLENGTKRRKSETGVDEDGGQKIGNVDDENDSIQDVLDENVRLDIDIEADGGKGIETEEEYIVRRPSNIDNVDPEHDERRQQQHQQQRQQGPASTSSSMSSPPPSSVATDQIQAAIHGSGVAVLVIIIVYAVSAVVVGTATREMDQKADAIVVGLGRMLSAFLFAVFSVTIPMWLGVTYSSSKHAYHKQHISHCTTQREVAFRVAWSLLGHFFVMYGIMLLYFCNPDPMTVPLSTGIGIVFGFGIVWLVWLGQTRYKKRRRLIAFLGSSTIAVASAAAFAAGCWYVKEVWYEGQDVGYQDDWTWFVFFGWLSLCMCANYVYYRLTRRKLAAAVANVSAPAASAAGTENRNIDANNSTAEGTAAGDNAQHEDDAKSTWRYQAKLFEPPESLCGAASELSKATTTAAVSGIKALRPNFDNLSVVSGGKKNRSRANTGDSSIQLPKRGNAEPTSYQTPVRRRSIPTELPSSVSPTALSSERTSSPLKFSSPSALFSPSAEGAIVLGNRNRTVSNVSSLGHDDVDEDPFASLSHSWEATVNGGGGQNSFQGNSFNVIDESDCESLSRRDGNDDRVGASRIDENNNGPSLWFMIKTNSCCGRRRYYNAQPRKPWERASNFIKWLLWTVTTGFHIYLTIVAIGATSQMNNVRAALPSTYAFLYPENYVEGTMCAWNESSPDGDIRTFATLDEVFAANYSVIHCGACNKCSNWNDLELQWTTRTHLAADGQECVKKSLGPGNGAEDVHQCNMELIGFTNDCSLCWTEDQMCASKCG